MTMCPLAFQASTVWEQQKKAHKEVRNLNILGETGNCFCPGVRNGDLVVVRGQYTNPPRGGKGGIAFCLNLRAASVLSASRRFEDVFRRDANHLETGFQLSLTTASFRSIKLLSITSALICRSPSDHRKNHGSGPGSESRPRSSCPPEFQVRSRWRNPAVLCKSSADPVQGGHA